MSETRKEWNHLPDLPIRVSPLWQWPPRPLAVLRWYADSWLWLTVNLIVLALALAAWAWASPSMETAARPGAWIAALWLRNAALLTLVAGSLHWWFHGRRLQGDRQKYDPRPFPRAGRVFTGGSQLADNVFWSLASGVTVWTLWEALVLWAMATGRAPVMDASAHPMWFVALFLLVPVWESFYFYWIHRALHSRWLYRFHAVHHRNTDVGPWSGLSMHPVEHLIYFGSALIHFVVPTHPAHLTFHLAYYALTAATTHTGFEGLWWKNHQRLRLGTFHHQLHHRYFEVNYGNLDVPWDKLFGSFHDGTEAGRAMMRERLRNRPR